MAIAMETIRLPCPVNSDTAPSMLHPSALQQDVHIQLGNDWSHGVSTLVSLICSSHDTFFVQVLIIASLALTSVLKNNKNYILLYCINIINLYFNSSTINNYFTLLCQFVAHTVICKWII